MRKGINSFVLQVSSTFKPVMVRFTAEYTVADKKSSRFRLPFPLALPFPFHTVNGGYS